MSILFAGNTESCKFPRNPSDLALIKELLLVLCLVVSGTMTHLVSGCGYQFQVEGPGPVIGAAAPAAARGVTPRMAIPNFENRTFEPNLEMKYTAYARREFSAGSGARLVSDPGEADLIFKGQIVSVIVPALAFTQSETFESRATVWVEATVEDVKTRKVVWRQKARGSSEFFVTTDLQFNRVLQARALEQAGMMIAADLAARFHAYLESVAQSTPPGSVPAGSEIPPLKPPLPAER